MGERNVREEEMINEDKRKIGRNERRGRND